MSKLENIIPLLIMQQRGFVAEGGGVSASTVIKRPSWDDMILNYPDSSINVDTLYAKIGNGLPKMLKENQAWENSCAFRMSKGLNYSGFKLPYNNSKYRAKGSTGGVHIGDDKLNYWYRVKELGKYLEEHLGSPEFDETLKKAKIGETKEELSIEKWDKLKNLKGIIMFKVSGWSDASGHFTLWDGSHLIYPGDNRHDDPNSNLYYFHLKEERYDSVHKKTIIIQTDEIKLWQLK